MENIEKKADELKRLISNEDIRYAHGQMDKTELEKNLYKAQKILELYYWG